MISKGWQHIGEPYITELSPDAVIVKKHIENHHINRISNKAIVNICQSLRMGFERVTDAIYEIKKQEAIMSRGKQIDESIKIKIVDMWKNQGISRAEIIRQLGISYSTVSRTIMEFNRKGMHNPDKKSQINEEFEQAVDQMIAEAEEKSADAEEKEEIAEPQKIPDVIWNALDDQVHALNMEIEERKHRIIGLTEEIIQLEDKRDAIEQWMEEHT